MTHYNASFVAPRRSQIKNISKNIEIYAAISPNEYADGETSFGLEFWLHLS